MKIIKVIAAVLLLVGGLNWGLTGIGMLLGSNLNVVNLIVGSIPVLEAIIYILVGVSAVIHLTDCKTMKK